MISSPLAFKYFGTLCLHMTLSSGVARQKYACIFKYGNADGDKHDFIQNVHGCK